MIDTSDIVGIWDKLKQSDRSRDAVYISKVRDQFQAEALDVTTTSIRKFVSILEYYRDQITGTDSSITDVEIRNRLLNALPSDPLWQNSKMWCLRENASLEQAITILESNHPIEAPSESANAVVSKGRSRNRGRGRGIRRGSGRGQYHDRGLSRSSSHINKGEYTRRAAKDEYMFCFKKGHFMKDYRELKRAQSANWEKEKKTADREQAKSSNVALTEEFDSNSLYNSLQVTITASERPTWILDSGVSKHFSGIKSDFVQLKR